MTPALEHPLRIIAPTKDAASIRSLAARWIETLAVRNYTPASLEHRAHLLHYFATWAEERGIARAAEVTKQHLKLYQRWMYHRKKADGQPLGTSTRYSRIAMVCVFFRWAKRHEHLSENPGADLELPKTEKRLPKAILTADEVEKVMAQPDISDPLDLRARAILEVLYATGMRRREVAGLHVDSIDQERGVVMIRQGKGRKDRVVPISERAIRWVRRYEEFVRPTLVVPDDGSLFVSSRGGPLGHAYIGDLCRRFIGAANVGKLGSAHVFRHTCATLMLEGGADIRYIQHMLGHEHLNSTELYTRVAIGKLKEVHTATHPGARSDHAQG